MRVVLKACTGCLVGRVVHESANEAKGLCLVQPSGTKSVGQLDFHSRRLLMELRQLAIQLALEDTDCSVRGQPLTERAARVTPQSTKARAGLASSRQPFMHKHQVQFDVIEVIASSVDMLDVTPDCVINDRSAIGRSRYRFDSAFA